MICYYGDAAQTAASLKICGDHFTRDLAHALRVTNEAAAQVPAQAPIIPTATEGETTQLATLQSELEKAQAQVAALQSALTPAPGATPEVTS